MEDFELIRRFKHIGNITLIPVLVITLLQKILVAVVYTERGDSTRIISTRKATKYEQRIFFFWTHA